MYAKMLSVLISPIKKTKSYVQDPYSVVVYLSSGWTKQNNTTIGGPLYHVIPNNGVLAADADSVGPLLEWVRSTRTNVVVLHDSTVAIQSTFSHMEAGPSFWIERPNKFDSLIFVISSHLNVCSSNERGRSSTPTINLLSKLDWKKLIHIVSTYLDISKYDVGTCSTGTIHSSWMACSIGEYRSWNE